VQPKKKEYGLSLTAQHSFGFKIKQKHEHQVWTLIPSNRKWRSNNHTTKLPTINEIAHLCQESGMKLLSTTWLENLGPAKKNLYSLRW